MNAIFHEKEYYVYEVLVNNIVRYIGKGRGNRIKRHVGIALALTRNNKHRYRRSKFYSHLSDAIASGAIVTTRYIATGLSSSDAFEREMIEIANHESGALWNATSGGEGIDNMTARTIALNRWSDPMRREKHRKILAEIWSNPEVLNRHKASIAHLDKSSITQRKIAFKRWSRPGERERQAIAARAAQRDRTARKRANILNSLLSFGA